MQPDQRAVIAQVVLEGVPLPASRRELLDYARSQGAPEEVLDAVSAIPDSRYERLDDVAEAILPRQPAPAPARMQVPSAESGAAPGGAAYVDASAAEPGEVDGRVEIPPYAGRPRGAVGR